MPKLSVSLFNKPDVAPAVIPEHCVKPHIAAWIGHSLPESGPREPGTYKPKL